MGKDREIHKAIAEGDIERVRKIIETKIQKRKKYTIDVAGEFGLTPLHYVLKRYIPKNKLEIFNLLINSGANPNARDDSDETPLIVACANCYESHGEDSLEIIKCLVEKGANVNAKSRIDRSPLYNACVTGNLQVVQYLFPKVIAFDSAYGYTDTPLAGACEYNKLEVIKFLLEKGTDPKKIPSKIYNQAKSEVKALLDTYKSHRPSNQQNNNDNNNNNNLNSSKTISQIRPISVAHANDGKEGEIHNAVMRGDVETIRRIISNDIEKKRYSINIPGQSGRTALHLAVRYHFYNDKKIEPSMAIIDCSGQVKVDIFFKRNWLSNCIGLTYPNVECSRLQL